MILTIDPGLNGTGLAFWKPGFRKLVMTDCFTPTGKNIQIKQINIMKQILSYKGITMAYIEYPMKFGGAGGDMVANKGDLVKLSALVGYIEGFLNAFSIPCHHVPVNKWKGQLPKEVVNKRIKKILMGSELALMSYKESHDWDAVGIGLYLRGDL